MHKAFKIVIAVVCGHNKLNYKDNQQQGKHRITKINNYMT